MSERGSILITGASAGFGAATARQFAAEGNRIIAVARRAAPLVALADEFGSDQVLPLTLDVSDRAEVEAAVASLPDEFADIDVLVNNAGLALGIGAAPDADLDDWNRMVSTNCSGLMFVTRAVLPGMVARNRGHIVNLGSVAGTYPYPGGNVYGATKAFVHQFSLGLRSDLSGTGIRVTCIEPGMCGGTEFSTIRFGGDADRAAAVYDGMQPITAEDIAGVIGWVVHQPPHVNINTVELMPTAQSFAAFQVARQAKQSHSDEARVR